MTSNKRARQDFVERLVIGRFCTGGRLAHKSSSKAAAKRSNIVVQHLLFQQC